MDTYQAYEAHFQNRMKHIRVNLSLAEKNITNIIDTIANKRKDYKFLEKVIDLMDEIDQQVDDLQEESYDIEKLSNGKEVYDSYYLEYFRERLGMTCNQNLTLKYF